ncbi:hypothetical protein LEP1GSC193_2834 [Leptospira alstonii serovar Pingchang str. 80-412]|uniref:Uncharacterized protein n=2 Tax=Leptospira alstonii TaxID=28452 RepID=M6CP52_9LEPT|nr:hypothetical protein LEP1GSC194_0239 [Leptospira alstonii serovar Sichuan str. 79601]EQA78874.1 hypothetical protein LEP1GSC193_2834 [Leptospira alstonii serovar Pingchang str. 80-412]
MEKTGRIENSLPEEEKSTENGTCVEPKLSSLQKTSCLNL